MSKRYEVTGTQPVLDNRMPGEKFNADIDPGQEQFLIGIGALRIISHDAEHDQRFAENKQSTPKKKG